MSHCLENILEEWSNVEGLCGAVEGDQIVPAIGSPDGASSSDYQQCS